MTDFDFNPTHPYQVATSGKDGILKIWDMRSDFKGPLTEQRGGSHWISSLQYNPFHDQLLLSGNTDGLVHLHSIFSVSSASETLENGERQDKEFGGTLSDGIVGKPNEYHEDSVYSVKWSAADPWIYASLSHDGRLVINTVPNETKYSIIL